ncbi:AraC family transcriptional regulator [Brevibacterium picturae]|uniref:HTH araC/xylS-type domain-containing protein n=1 Tax=Brevibacterium picturae TaxID=260553 RepID=A0ABN2BUH8_9MICO
MKLIFIRDGSAVLLSEFGEKPVNLGDVIALGANTLCAGEPADSITLTTVYPDRDYVIDQVFWQHVTLLIDRLDELVALSLNGISSERFYRMQALLFAVLDVITPYVRTTAVRRSVTQCRVAHPSPPRRREFAPLRAEARQAVELLRREPAERWTLQHLAEAVHLSPSQLGRVFVDAYGKSPLTYLVTIRAEHLARLLRETDLPIEEAMRRVGWHSRGHAARMFRQAVGVTPTRYRELSRQKTAA